MWLLFCPIYSPVKNNSTRLSHSDPWLARLHLNSEFWGTVCSISSPFTDTVMPPTCSRKMPAQTTCNLSAKGGGGNPRITIHNHLDGLPKLGDSSLIRGNAPANIKRLVKNALDAYGVGGQDCFASSVGQSVRLIEVCVKHSEPKERSEASTIAEVTVSQGTSRWIIEARSLSLWEF